jgi:hypothetical protein
MPISPYPEFFAPHKPITLPQHIYVKNTRAEDIVIGRTALFEP